MVTKNGPGGMRVRVIADSIAMHHTRVISVEAIYHRYIHGEVMTHKKFSRNAMSSRAIPVTRMIQMIQEQPAIPVFWGKNQKGMQADEELPADVQKAALEDWLGAFNAVLPFVQRMHERGVHKQVANRPLEPWMYMRTIITADQFGWANTFNLRDHPAAQPEFRTLAALALDAVNDSKPKALLPGQWHLPYIRDEELAAGYSDDDLLDMSAARCARVSYNKHDGGTSTLEDDHGLAVSLKKEPHASPFEHQLKAMEEPKPYANFIGWMPYRQLIPNEFRSDYSKMKTWKFEQAL